MLEVFFFILGLVNSVFLIFIFLIRKNRLALLRRIGWIYLLLAIPATYGIFLVVHEQKTVRHISRNLPCLFTHRMVVWSRFQNRFSWELEEELEVGCSLLRSLLRDELWICGDAMDNFFGVGTHHARPFYYPNNRKPTNPSQYKCAQGILKYRAYSIFLLGKIDSYSRFKSNLLERIVQKTGPFL